jgi:hypothetical protein
MIEMDDSVRMSYADVLDMDLVYDLIVCMECHIGLPLEWAKGHCHMAHKTMVSLTSMLLIVDG